MNDADAELAFRYLPDAVQGDAEHDAYAAVLSAWEDDRPDNLARLEVAHEDTSSPFNWESLELTFEASQVDGRPELTPHTATGNAAEDVHDLARGFGWDYVSAVRDEVRTLQSQTDFSPREFVALVLSESKLDEQAAASAMDISRGNYRGKINGNVSEKIETAEETLTFAERLGR